MADWRKPTFDEAQVVLREEKDRIRRKRSDVSIFAIVFALFFAMLFLLDDSTVRERAGEILGYDPRHPPVLATENFKYEYQKQQQEIADATARAESETLAVYVPILIGLEGGLAGLYLAYWMKTARFLGRYAKLRYEVTSGVCVRKVFEGGYWYYLTAFLEDESKQEAKVSREVYYQAEPYSQLLIVHLNSKKEWSTSFLRAFVIGPPIPPAGKGSSVPKFMVGREEVDNSTYMAGFESLLPPAIDDPSQPNFMDADADVESIEADKIGKDLIGDEWKRGSYDRPVDDLADDNDQDF